MNKIYFFATLQPLGTVVKHGCAKSQQRAYSSSRLIKFLCTMLICIASGHNLFAQCMLQPVPLSTMIQQSSVVIEGQVLSTTCQWDDNEANIYTIYEIAVLRSFKGTAPSSIKVIERGGIVGLAREVNTNSVMMGVGNTGVFALKQSTQPFDASNQYYSLYASVQSAILYDPVTHGAGNVFNTYSNVQTGLYSSIESITSITSTAVAALDWSTVVAHHTEHQHDQSSQKSNNGGGAFYAVAAGASISGFLPASLNAGKRETLTINGTGFGASRGTSEVQFNNADNPGTWISALGSQYVSWSNTQIVVYVPEPAGTGNIRVTDGINTATSTTALQVNYCIINLVYDQDGGGAAAVDTAYIARHINQNGTGGYTFRPYTAFSANTGAKTDMVNVIDQWSCASGINWAVGADTTVNTTADDNVNIVRFDVGTELDPGVLGVATSRYSGCITAGRIFWFIEEIDITIDDGTSWFYGNVGVPSFTQFDFYTVMLHEVGHAIQLGHVVDNNKVMHYAVSNGAQKRIINATELAGAQYVVDTLGPIAVCGKGAHVKYFCNPPVTLTVSNTSMNENGGSRTVTATIPGANNNPVVVTLTLSGTASNTDYSMPVTITIPPGSLSSQVTLSSIDDNVFEGNETVVIDITSVSNGTENGTQQATVTITDNETTPTVTLSVAPSSITEGNSSSVTATLSNATGTAVTVNLSYSGTATDGSDYSSISSITIPALATSANVAIAATDDAIYEPTQSIIIDISTVSNATESGTQQATISILDNEVQPTITFTPPTNAVISESGTSATVSVSSNIISEFSTTVNLSYTGTASSGTDYSNVASVSIMPGASSGSGAIAITNDNLYEGNEQIYIDISSVTNGMESGVQKDTIQINDDEVIPTISIAIMPDSVQENAGTQSFTLSLSGLSAVDIPVTISASGVASAADYSVGTAYTISAASTSTSGTVTITDDAIDEHAQNIVLQITSHVGAAAGTLSDALWILDNDVEPTLAMAIDKDTMKEGLTADSVLVSFTLSAASEKDVTVNYTLAGSAATPSDYTVAASPAVLLAGTTTALLPIKMVDDVADDDWETITVDLVTTVNASSMPGQAILYIQDDEVPNIAISYRDVLPVAANDTVDGGQLNAGQSYSDFVAIYNTGTGILTYSTDVYGPDEPELTVTNGGAASVFVGSNLPWNFDYNNTCGDTGMQYITYEVASNAVNTPVFVFTIKYNVQDTTAPLPHLGTIDVAANCSITVVAPTATDDCDGVINGTTSDPTTFTENGTYTITWSYEDAQGNVATQAQSVLVENNIEVSVAGTAVCNGLGSVDVVATGGSNTYTGDGTFPIATAGTYTYIVTDATHGCTAVDSVSVAEAVTVMASNLAIVDSFCSTVAYDATLDFAVEAVATGTGVLYSWSGAYYDVANAANANASIAAGAQWLVVNVTDGSGCTAADSFMAFGYTIPSLTVASSTVTLCEGNSAVLTASATPALLPTWSGGVVDNEAFVFTTDGIYTASVVDASGCTSTATVDVQTTPSAGLALTTAGNVSAVGNACVTFAQPDGTSLQYTDAACNTICEIRDAASGNTLGDVDVCVFVDAVAPYFNGQFYAPRYYDVTPATQGPSISLFYFTSSDLQVLDDSLVANGLTPVMPNTIVGTATYSLAQVSGGLFPSSPSNVTMHNVTATYNADLNAWEVPVALTGFSGFYLTTNAAPLAIEPLITITGTTNTGGFIVNTAATGLPIGSTYQLLHGSEVALLEPIAPIILSPSGTASYTHSTNQGLAYYQILATTPTGKHLYSNTLMLDKRASIFVYPNPATNTTKLVYTAAEEDQIAIAIVDVLGREHLLKNTKVFAGKNEIVLPLQKLSAGSYTILVSKNGLRVATLLIHKNG
jgi:hypothetical protein